MNNSQISDIKNEIPLFLTVKDIQRILGISINTA